MQQTAHADLWVWLDDRGVAHLAAEQVDGRYSLFHRSAEPALPADGASAGHGAPTPAGHGTADNVANAASAGSVSTAARLRRWIEASPLHAAARPHLVAAARTHGLDLDLLTSLVAAESGFDPQAVSSKGAIGLMQLLPATAERYGASGDQTRTLAQRLADPAYNVAYGARHLRELLALYPGRTDLALAAYNAGEGAVQRAGGRVPDFRETRLYVATLQQLHQLLRPPTPPVPLTAAEPAGSATAVTRRLDQLPTVPGRANMVSTRSALLPAPPMND